MAFYGRRLDEGVRRDLRAQATEWKKLRRGLVLHTKARTRAASPEAAEGKEEAATRQPWGARLLLQLLEGLLLLGISRRETPSPGEADVK